MARAARRKNKFVEFWSARYDLGAESEERPSSATVVEHELGSDPMDELVKNPAVRFGAAFTVLLVLTLLLLSRWGVFGPRPASADELHAQILGAGAEEARLEAAIALSRHADATPAMLRKIIEECDLPAAQAAAISALGNQKEIDSLPTLIDAMESPSELVRGRAGVAVERIVGLRLGFNASDSIRMRQAAVARYRTFWADCQKPDSKFLEYYRNPAAVEESARRASQMKKGDEIEIDR